MKATGIAFLLAMSIALAQDPEVLFEGALNKEAVAGDLKGAIEQYKAVIAASGTNRALAAKAMLHLAQSQEKLGQRDAALASYQRLVKDYADQPGVAGLAKAKAESMALPAATGPEFENLDFQSGEAGQVPPGWFVPAVLRDAGYRSELRKSGCGARPSCVVIMTVPDPPHQMFGNLMQSIPATRYQGKTVRLRARLRLEASGDEDSAQMWLRVDRPGQQIGGGAFDNMGNRPVKSAQWTNAEIVAPIAPDANRLNIGVMSIGKGKAWVEAITLEIVPDSTPNTAKNLTQGPAFGVATATFPYKDALGKRVRFSGYIKTEGITRGYAGLWWRVDGKSGALAFDNMGDRGAKGSTDWQRYEIELPVAAETININFGTLLTGNGQAYFDSLSVELDGAPYSKPSLDLDFEGSTPTAFYLGGQGYEVRLDPKAARTGRQGLRMTYTGPATATNTGPRFGVATATFPVAVAAGKSIRYSGFIKTQDVRDGHAGLWWRVDGVDGPNRVLAFDNMDKTGPRGTTEWKRFEIVLPVAKEAKNINFGALLTGKGTAWFDGLIVEVDGVPYLDRSVFDLDFEAPAVKGMYTGGEGYKVQLDKETVMRGTQSLRMQSVQ